MCGIAGIFLYRADRKPYLGHKDAADIRNMTGALAHRGPDAEGFYFGEKIHLGARRLAIRGIQDGNQPVYNETKEVIAVYNGEIYNAAELKAQLQAAGHTFQSHSDTELLVHLYETYGMKMTEKINGQFAFAVYDKAADILFLGRDRTGICPLYYAVQNGCLYFASEIKALAQTDWFLAKPDAIGIAQALKYWTAVSPRTIFQQICSIPPCGCLKVSGRDRKLQLEKYDSADLYDKRNAFSFHNLKDAQELLRKYITRSVERRLCKDASVELGAYVSGGLDSAIIAYTMAQLNGGPIRTFSVAFDHQDFDESSYQKKCLDKLGLSSGHAEVLIREEDLVSSFPKVIWHTEFPFFRTAPIPMYLLSKEAHAQGVKAVLSGEGADEIFYGYDSFKDALVLDYWSHHIDSWKRPQKLKEYHPHMQKLQYEYLRGYYKKFLQHPNDPFLSMRPKWENGRRLFSFFSEDVQSDVNGMDMEAELLAELPEQFLEMDSLKRCQSLEMELLLNGYLLSSQGDRVLYANSVEGRYPFLDEELISLAGQIPNFQKLKGMQEKQILRSAYEGLLPEEIRIRKKFPYHASGADVFFRYRHQYDYIDKLLTKEEIEKTGIFSYKSIQRLKQKYEMADYEHAVSTREDLLIMFVLGTQALFHMARNRFRTEW